MIVNPAQYFKQYREALGFSSQGQAKDFLAAKNVTPSINFDYIDSLNSRIVQIITRVNDAIHKSAKRADIESFCQTFLFRTYDKIRTSKIIPRLNNQGRRPEEVLFSWMRGYVISEYFTPSIAKIFNTSVLSVTQIGDDDLSNIETFKRSPKADLELPFGRGFIRIEVQSGFQGINDIKEHKVREARRVSEDKNCSTICIHFDLFNGQVAFVQLDKIQGNDVNWITRQQMEGQSVFAIEQNYFKWRLLDNIASIADLDISL